MLAHHDADDAHISGSGDSCRAGEQSRPHIIIITPTTSPPGPSPASASRRLAKTQPSFLHTAGEIVENFSSTFAEHLHREAVDGEAAHGEGRPQPYLERNQWQATSKPSMQMR
jgi:hypothetical protein